jgi:PDZ domain/Aspartyl protease
MNKVPWRFLSITFFWFILSPAPSLAQQQADEKHVETVLESFKVHRHGDVLIVPVTFKGKEYQFLVDTGASMTIFDTSLPLGPVKQRAEVESAVGPTTISIFAGQQFSVGKLTIDAGDFTPGVDFTKLRAVSGYPIYGMLGMDFLSKYAVQIDFDEGELRLVKIVGSKTGTPFQLRLNEGKIPTVEVMIQGIPKKVAFDIDTGSVYCDLEPRLLSQLAKKGECQVVGQRFSETLKGTSTSRIARGKKMSLGEFAIPGPVFSEASRNRIGLTFLSRFKVTFDFPGGALYLRKGSRFEEPDVWDLSGLHVLRKQGQIEVDSVDKGSAAAKSEIQAGDKIVRIGDAKADQASLIQFRRLCGKRNSTLNLTIERQQKTIDVKVELKYP